MLIPRLVFLVSETLGAAELVVASDAWSWVEIEVFMGTNLFLIFIFYILFSGCHTAKGFVSYKSHLNYKSFALVWQNMPKSDMGEK
jgi:hypothetical protein